MKRSTSKHKTITSNQKPPELGERTCGILFHPTSLPSPYGIGDLGPEAYRFVDFLRICGQSWWQMLPIGPIGFGNSPYLTQSAFAGNPILISLEALVDDDLLEANDIIPPKSLMFSERVDYLAAQRFKNPRLRKAFATFETQQRTPAYAEFEEFCANNEGWLNDYTLFTILKQAHYRVSWTSWETDLRKRKKIGLRYAMKHFSKEIQFRKFLQYEFFRQWSALKQYCQDRDIGLIGDVPFFVAQESADVWANPELFRLDNNGRQTVVAGVPPDYFSSTGQLWGNPLYRWDVLSNRGYDWWIARFKAMIQLFDIVRLDHFIGFARYWEIPASARTALSGHWVRGPGASFFTEVLRTLRKLPLIAEDLGSITPEVTALREKFGFPGMRVLQFAFNSDVKNKHLPHNFPKACVVYTGTHDNRTTVEWFKYLTTKTGRAPISNLTEELDFALRYLGSDGQEIHWDMIRLALASVADTAIIPLQDILGLGSEARMNRPARAKGNWDWRLKKASLTDRVSERLLDSVTTYARRKE